MSARRNSTDPPVKKPIYRKWWFWAIIVFIGLGAFGSTLDESAPDVENTPPVESVAPPSVTSSPNVIVPSATPALATDDPVISEEEKAAAKQADLDISAICTAAESDYQAFLEIMASGNVSDLDMYNAAKTLKENLQYYNYTQLSDIKAEEIDAYKQSAALYIFVMSEVADKTMKYLDDPVTSKLSDLQSSMEGISPYMYDVVSEKFTYLSDSGFTADEIAEMTTANEEDTE